MASKFSLEPIFLLSLSPSAPAPAPYGPACSALALCAPIPFARPWPSASAGPVRPCPTPAGPTGTGLPDLNPVRAAPPGPAFATPIPFARPHRDRSFQPQSRSRSPTGTGLSDLSPVRVAPLGPAFSASVPSARPAPAPACPCPVRPCPFHSVPVHLEPPVALPFSNHSLQTCALHLFDLFIFLSSSRSPGGLPPPSTFPSSSPPGFRSGAKSSSAPETGSPALRDLLPSSSSKPSSTPDLSRFQTFFTPSSPSDINSSFNQSQPASPRQRRSS